mgnify:CR=1 FL=1
MFLNLAFNANRIIASLNNDELNKFQRARRLHKLARYASVIQKRYGIVIKTDF